MAGPNSFDPVTDNTLLPYGATLIAQGDDNSERFEITSVFENGFLFGDRTFSELFVSTNGGVTFVDQTLDFFGTFENTDFVIAPFFDDLDNRTLPPGPTPGIYFDTNTARDSVVVTWDGVGIFPNDVSAPNTFQLEMIDLEGGDTRVIFRFENMGNARDDTFQMGLVADGGPRLFLRGGTAADALGTAEGMDTLVGNTGVAGVWIFDIVDGRLQVDDLIGNTETGNANPNTLIGTDRNDVLRGGGGNDTIFGRPGIDRLFGDEGDDSLLGEGDDDSLFGNAGADVLDGGEGDDTLSGGEGDDRLVGGGGINELDGGAGADTLDGTGGASFAAYGSSGAGLTVNLGNTALNTGDAAGDTYTAIFNILGSDFGDDLTGDGTDNTIRGAEGADALSGEGGDDTLFGEAGNDTLVGGDGDDELVGGTGADVLIGGTGINLASYRDTDAGLAVDLADPTSNTGDAAGDSYSGISGVIGGTGADLLAGNGTANRIEGLDGDDYLRGRAGDDTLIGGNEDDTLEGGEGADQLEGGRGTDAASYAGAAAGVTAALDAPGSNSGEAAGDTYAGIETLIGSAFDDSLSGDDLAEGNRLTGGAGDDTLSGLGGDDTLDGGAGADRLLGGAGIDTADYASAASGVAASLFDPSGNTGDARGDTYDGIENLIGSGFDDRLGDTAGDNSVMAGAGNDLILSRGGADTLDGGAGEDTLSYADTGFVVVDLEDPNANAGAAAGAFFDGIEHVAGSAAADDLFGDGFDNSLSGGGNNDNLDGRDGDDTLDGGAGDDRLTGGAGADTVVLRLGMGDDTVTDFDIAADALDFSALTAAERAAVTVASNTAGDRVVTLGDGSSLTMTGLPANFLPTGAPTIAGTATEDQTLTAGTGTIGDLDGLGSFAFQWLRGGVAIAGATGAAYTLVQADVGAQIAVRVSYTDGFGTVETLTGAPTAPVGNVNDAPGGAPVISGTAAFGAILEVLTGTIQDEDGLGAFAVQWLRDGAPIAGATAATYGIGAADAGTGLSVRVSYTDQQGTAESLTSAPVAVPIDQVFPGGPGNDSFDGGIGADTISGLEGDDTLSGGAGTDFMTGGPGNDSLFGGDHADTIAAGEDADTVLGGNGPDLVYLNQGDDLYIDNAQGGRLGQDTVFGGLGNDTIEGGNGDDEFHGEWGDDVINARLGNDTVYGGDGNDTIAAGDGNDVVRGGNGRDLVFLGNGNDVYSGSGQAGPLGSDTVFCGAGADFVEAGDGDDEIHGQADNDGLYGMQGNDLIFGGDGFDTIAGDNGDDTAFGGNGRDLVFLGAGNDLFFDNGQGGDLGRDTVFGGYGNDTIQGGNGDDVFHGEVGNDVINARLGNDQVFGGDGNDTITGGDGNDTLFGGNGQDRVFLGAGNDRFIDTAQAGTLGQDTITGGAGADVFVFARAMSADIITDYAIGIDRLEITAVLAGGRSAAQLEAAAQVTASGVLLDFGSGDRLLLEGLTDKAGLAGDILLI